MTLELDAKTMDTEKTSFSPMFPDENSKVAVRIFGKNQM
jgi:hypothetical protein